MKKLLVLFLALPWLAFAEPAGISIDQAVESALANNLSLQRSSIDLNAKKRQSDVAPWALLPNLSASTSLNRPNHAYNGLGTEVSPSWSLSLSYGASISWTAGAFANIALAQTNYQNGLLNYSDAKRALEKNVRLAFYGLLLGQRRAVDMMPKLGSSHTYAWRSQLS